MDVFLLDTWKNNYHNLFTIILRTFGDIWNFSESGIWNSGILELPWNWLIFDQFQCIGYFFHSIFITELDFQVKIWKLHFFRNLEFRILEFCIYPGIGCFLPNFNVLRIFSTQFLSLNLIFSSDFKNSILSGIWNLELSNSGITMELALF